MFNILNSINKNRYFNTYLHLYWDVNTLSGYNMANNLFRNL